MVLMVDTFMWNILFIISRTGIYHSVLETYSIKYQNYILY